MRLKQLKRINLNVKNELPLLLLSIKGSFLLEKDYRKFGNSYSFLEREIVFLFDNYQLKIFLMVN